MQGFELIARLGYSTTRWGDEGAGYSEGRLMRVELAGLLKSLSHEQLTLVLAKYGGDQNAVLECVRLTQLWTHARALRLDWPPPTNDLFDKMAESAAFEMIHPNRCRGCKGIGLKNHKVCHSCGATGFNRLSMRALSDYLAMNRQAFSKIWYQRYEDIIRHLQTLESQAQIIINMNNKG